jgi:putative transposase
VAIRLIKSKDLVAYEDLNVAGLVKNRKLAKSISDVGWSTFRRWLEYFANKYGKIAIAVSPYNTSQECSSCGEIVKKSLSTRTHVCHHCGFVEDRDVNAALVILQRGLSTLGHRETHAWGDETSTLIEEILSRQVMSENQESPHL